MTLYQKNDSIGGNTPTLKGKEYIKSQITDLPELPGIYRMLDSSRNILYIGKAKNLKNRISQYKLKLNNKNEKMISLTYHLEYTITKSESAALLLEGQLIKRFKPKFNILLKDDKSFPYIKLRLDTDYPQLLKYRGKTLENGKFFGPFASSSHVDTTIAELQKIFRLRSCTDSYFASRTRPCMQYQIKKCCGPCVSKVTKQEYKALTKQVESFFAGKNTDLQKSLSKKMHQYSEETKYEQAAEIRDRIRALSYIQMRSKTDAKTLYDADIFAISENKGEYCVQLFMYRQGQPCGNTPYFPAQTEDSNAQQVMSSFLGQFYQNKIPPNNIYISHDIDDIKLIEKTLKDAFNKNISIAIPKFGEKYELIQTAIQNADLALAQHLKKTAKNVDNLKQVTEIFALEQSVERIEIYDNSHIQGTHAIGAMVVAGKEGFNKKEYRLFNIKGEYTHFGGDDYSMLSEVLIRRLKRLKSEPSRRPDLMIIDGGKGHLSTALKIMSDFKEDIPIVAMSKGEDRNSGREQFHMQNKETFTISSRNEVMKYLQILRDEAHNFAITSHRKKRSRAISYSKVEDIPGIGKHRKKLLLDHFGSFKAVSDATIEELKRVEGISTKTAKQIYTHLNSS